MQNSSNNLVSMASAYLTLRRAIGFLGLVLPVILVLGCTFLILAFDCPESCGDKFFQKNLSNYYHTGMRNIFVGTLCVVGVFLLGYKGYKKEDDREGEAKGLCAIGAALFATDDRAGDVAGVAAIGVALFPTAGGELTIIGVVHGVSTAVFFLMLAYFSLCLFTKTGKSGKMKPKKIIRNRIYLASGYTILAAIVLVTLLWLLSRISGDFEAYIEPYNPAFWLESVAVMAFGVSWLTKGEAILQDLQETGSQ